MHEEKVLSHGMAVSMLATIQIRSNRKCIGRGATYTTRNCGRYPIHSIIMFQFKITQRNSTAVETAIGHTAAAATKKRPAPIIYYLVTFEFISL